MDGEDSFVSSVDTAFKKVTIQDEYGTYSFRVDAMKIRKNIVSSPGEQGLHTVVCLTHPLSVDTLNILWRTMLNERQKFPIRTGLKLTVLIIMEWSALLLVRIAFLVYLILRYLLIM